MHQVGAFLEFSAKDRQPEVTDLDIIIFINEYVLRLKVSMRDSLFMAVVKAFQYLAKVFSSGRLVHSVIH